MTRLIASALLLPALAAAPVVAADRDDGFDRPRRPNGSMVIRPQPGSLPFDGDWEALSAVAVEREHYPWDPDVLDAQRREAYVSTEIPEGYRLGSAPSGSPSSGFGRTRAPNRGITFEGLNAQTASYQGRVAFPPDAILGASSTRVLQGSNVALRLTDRAGVEIDRKPLNTFFGFLGNELLFDPRVYFDRLSGRFFVVALEQQQDIQFSGIWLAVSKNASPTALQAPSDFCTYRIPAKRADSWADFPMIGINEKFFAISVNNFRFGNGFFRRAHVYVMPVARITDNATACPTLGIKRFDPQRGADTEPAFSIHPALHYSTNDLPGTPLFMVSTGFLLPTDHYTLWRIAGPANNPTLSKQLVRGDFDYFFAPLAPQKGGGQELDSGDPRITQVAYRDGKLWAVQGTACSIGPLPNEACIRAIQITPAESGPSAITYSETFGRPNQFMFWPSIAINRLGDVAMAFQKSKADAYLGVVFNGKRADAPHFDTMRNLRIGNCTLIHIGGDGVTRTGDYVGVQTDPADNLGFWMTGEYPGNIAGATVGCNWKTYVGRAQY